MRAARLGWLGVAALLCGTSWTRLDTNAGPRLLPVTVVLADGRVLVTGGFDTNTASYLGSSYLYTPWTGRFERAIDVLPRGAHRGLLLPDGRVMIAGGSIPGGPTAATELLDPLVQTVSDGGLATFERQDLALSMRPNGTVMMFTGRGPFLPIAAMERWSNGRWTPEPFPLTAVYAAAVTARLTDGLIVVGGGVDDGGPSTQLGAFYPDGGSWRVLPAAVTVVESPTATHVSGGVLFAGSAGSGTDFWNESTGAIVPGPTVTRPRRNHVAVAMADGTTLLLAGLGPAAMLDGERCSLGGCASLGGLPVPSPYFSGAALLVDGTVLLVSGRDGSGATVPEAWLIDPGGFTPAPAQQMPFSGGDRERHTATLLPDGVVFVAGGSTNDTTTLLFQRDGGWVRGPQLTTRRTWFRAELLLDGTVLLVGGSPDAGSERCIPNGPDAGCWPTGPQATPRGEHMTVMLDDGRVLAFGGSPDPQLPAGQVVTLRDSEIYDPATDTWSDAGTMLSPSRSGRAVLLPDGRVLTTAGYGGAARLSQQWSPASGWSDAGLTTVNHAEGMMALLADGTALAAGGCCNTAVAEVYVPGAGWRRTGDLPVANVLMSDVLTLSNRTLLLSGGATTAVVEHLPFDGGLFRVPTSLATARFFHTTTRLLDGRVLAAGGVGTVSAELIVDDHFPVPLVRPLLDPVPSAAKGSQLKLHGTGFTPEWEAGANGGGNAAWNHPLVRLERVGNRALSYPRVLGWDATEVLVALPGTLAAGWYTAHVIVGGAISEGRMFRIMLGLGDPCVTAATCLDGACVAGRCEVSVAPDGGTTTDGGTVTDGGVSPDAGLLPDGGMPAPGTYTVRCGCSAAEPPGLLALAGAAASFRRRRKYRGPPPS